MPNQNSGEGRGSLRPGDLGEGGVDHPPDQTGGEVCVLVFGGIDAPVDIHVCTSKFSGLVSFYEFTSSSDRKLPADYGLVFRYHPFLGTRTQTVTMD